MPYRNSKFKIQKSKIKRYFKSQNLKYPTWYRANLKITSQNSKLPLLPIVEIY